ncbi:hypothetical protein CXF83_08385 [Shewanella sp. Choline-02u-19]|jgi:hypothetical protein|uniref:hypothetical protein n=1 Tax=unclassified Shewanella TaxID=196818 RepID=UPI000C33EBA2|nr:MULTISPECIES: hypothetical protein [unclassified Shewanella]PKG56022.1 hypothetical protein CXF82_16860 [Shewanella sp. GutDb-MelDb]PKG73989.1 hypothetical protein CXF86_14960 [Shewanella sp. GutCb]PKH54985.1 hypothetical protein CXF84_19365 [Shewanella sp. Bg11-22]PKI26757.1 hypothetical protein CXF83_08385 [Shewanella sp. Choline-02u-19]
MKVSISGTETISIFQLTAVFSMLFALVGFSYNVWRMEITEYNNNVRSASFELLLQLSELESIIYAAHYDQDIIQGSPRKGWVKVNLIADLSVVTEPEIQAATERLKANWQLNWESVASDENSAMQVVEKIDDTRLQVRQLLSTLE